MSREYTLKIASRPSQATSENMAAWIEELLAKGGKLERDPGAGEESLSLSLDPEKVSTLANKRREQVPALLRRILATKAGLAPAPKPDKSIGEAMAGALPSKILPPKLRFEETDLLAVVQGLDKGMAASYRQIYGLRELKSAETPEEDRELAAAMAETLNRRAPKWLVENADLAKLTVIAVKWSLAQTEDLDRQVRDAQGAKRGKPAPGAKASPIEVPWPETRENPATVKGAAAEPPAADADAGEAAMDEHLLAPVQQEGEF
jgi:hypothetical protein